MILNFAVKFVLCASCTHLKWDEKELMATMEGRKQLKKNVISFEKLKNSFESECEIVTISRVLNMMKRHDNVLSV